MAKGKGDVPPHAEQPARLPATIPQHGRMVPSKDASLAECPTNLDLSSAFGKAMAFNAMSPADMQIGDEGEIQILATHYLLFPDTGIDPETGELHEFTRSVFFDREGRTFRTTSGVAPHKLAAAVALFSVAEWKKGVPFTITERRSRKTGRVYHDVRISPVALSAVMNGE